LLSLSGTNGAAVCQKRDALSHVAGYATFERTCQTLAFSGLEFRRPMVKGKSCDSFAHRPVSGTLMTFQILRTLIRRM